MTIILTGSFGHLVQSVVPKSPTAAFINFYCDVMYVVSSFQHNNRTQLVTLLHVTAPCCSLQYFTLACCQ